MPPQIFKNAAQQATFEKQGFIVLPLLDEATVKRLDKRFDEMHTDLPTNGFISGSYSPDFSYKKAASDLIKEQFEPHFERLFQNYTALGGAFLFKMPSEDSALMMHQDWSIVDEDKYFALNVWVPLTDTNAKNGPLMVLPGSHYQKLNVLRAPTLPFFFSGHEEVLREKLVPFHVKAGEAVILNQSVVHYSPANLSGKIRKAITAGVISEGAGLRFYYNDKQSDKEELEVFAQENDFLIRFDNFFKDIFQRPTFGQSQGKIPYKVPAFSRPEMEKLVQKMTKDSGYPYPSQAKFIDKLRKLFDFAYR